MNDVSATLAWRDDQTDVAGHRRLRVHCGGLVQGVGFRPFVSRLAAALKLSGWVNNSASGAVAEIEGVAPAIEEFLHRLRDELPPLAQLDNLDTEALALQGGSQFTIRASTNESDGPGVRGARSAALVMPDVATCAECIAQILNPADRRYRYPFTTCAQCGPRFSILEGLPYDREQTTMRGFAMCVACAREYRDPLDRRFHAQAIACPDCGPRLSLVDCAGHVLAQDDPALLSAAAAIRSGKIVALKGLGGYQLLVNASDQQAVVRLRRRKHRPEKPFALMAPDLSSIHAHCELSVLARELLGGPAAPVVLLPRRATPHRGESSHRAALDTDPSARLWPIASAVAPGVNTLGYMLPCTPLHHLLMRDLGFTIVATSGNTAGSPMVTGNDQALEQLGDVADVFLMHDREVASPVDDSVVRVVAGRALFLRRARGYAPLPVVVGSLEQTVLALGGHQKAVIAVSHAGRALVGPHIGDLDGSACRRAFDAAVDRWVDCGVDRRVDRTVTRLPGLHAVNPAVVACDKHPDYYTSQAARRYRRPVIAVQHHVAHILSCIADNKIDGPVLGVAWDGSGYGDDGTIRGGEFIVVDGLQVQRVATFRSFMLPGAGKAISEPRRSAIGLLYELSGAAALNNPSSTPARSFSESERVVLGQMLEKNLNAPRTSSVGRLFDAVASLTGLSQVTTYQGQAAMAVEFAARGSADTVIQTPVARYAFDYLESEPGTGEPAVIDWAPVVRALVADTARGVRAAVTTVAFQNALVDTIAEVAQRAGQPQVVLTGGCFQNQFLTEAAVQRLRDAGFEPFWHKQVPPNDGGLALGQLLWATRVLQQEAH